MSSAKAAGGDDLPIMQDEEIHWNGRPISLVLAVTQEQADHAKSLLSVTYDTEPSVTLFEKAKTNAKPGVFQREPLLLEIDDAEASLSSAPIKSM